MSEAIEKQIERFDTALWMPFFQEAAKNESSNFFGYHATTSAHYVLNLIIKLALQHSCKLNIPDDFYFLRSPDPSRYTLHSVDEFFEKYKEPALSASEKKKFVKSALLQPLNKASRRHITIGNLTSDEFETIYKGLIYSNLKSSQLVRHFPQKVIQRYLKDPIGFCKKWGNELDESLLFLIKNPILDTNKHIQKELISLNIPLYAHFTIPTESTMHIVANNESIDMEAIDRIIKELRSFLDRMGYERECRDALIKIAKSLISQPHGVLLQFFARDDAFLDRYAYIATNFGTPSKNKIPSKIVTDYDPKIFEKATFQNKEILIHPQLRLVLSMQATLNPNSRLKIRCYHKIPQSEIDAFKCAASKILEDAKVDQAKLDAFSAELYKAWS